MSRSQNEAAPAAEGGALAKGKNPWVGKGDPPHTTGKIGESGLPSLAGPSGLKHVPRADSSSSASRQSSNKTKSRKRNRNGGGSGGWNSRQNLTEHIKEATHSYRMTELYRNAASKGFKTQKALETFNAWVATVKDQIDPAALVFCEGCSQVCDNLTLCPCFVLPAPDNAEIVDNALHVPVGPTKFRWTFQFWNGVKQWFARPSVDLTAYEQPFAGGFSNSELDSSVLEKDLFAYLVLRGKSDYLINGSYDRRAKLSHMTRLADQWCVEKKIRHSDFSMESVHRFRHTIQRATDEPMADMLSARTDPVKNKFWQYFQLARAAENVRCLSLPMAVGIPFLAGFALSTTFRNMCLRVLLRMITFPCKLLVRALVEISLIGSKPVLKSVIRLLINLALRMNIFLGKVFSRLRNVLRLFMRTVATMSTRVYINDILRKLCPWAM